MCTTSHLIISYLPSNPGLDLSLLRQLSIRPSDEPVGFVPRTLPVPHEDDLVGVGLAGGLGLGVQLQAPTC